MRSACSWLARPTARSCYPGRLAHATRTRAPTRLTTQRVEESGSGRDVDNRCVLSCNCQSFPTSKTDQNVPIMNDVDDDEEKDVYARMVIKNEINDDAEDQDGRYR